MLLKEKSDIWCAVRIVLSKLRFYRQLDGIFVNHLLFRQHLGELCYPVTQSTSVGLGDFKLFPH
jgi:hypothetical protein